LHGRCTTPLSSFVGRQRGMALYESGHPFEAHGAMHVRYYFIEIVDGQPKRTQRSGRSARETKRPSNNSGLRSWTALHLGDSQPRMPRPSKKSRTSGREARSLGRVFPAAPALVTIKHPQRAGLDTSLRMPKLSGTWKLSLIVGCQAMYFRWEGGRP
jgi:hypothetical protein